LLTGPQRLTLIAILNRLIPADRFPAVSELGAVAFVEARLASSHTAAAPGVLAFLTELEQPTPDGATDIAFTTATASEQDAWLARAFADRAPAAESAAGGALAGASVTAPLSILMELAAQCWLGQPHSGAGDRSPWSMIGFRPEPDGMVWPDTPVSMPAIGWSEVADAYDAVVIGSGPGGATAAQVLCTAGWRVLVVERGEWLGAGDLPADHLRNDRSATGLLPPTSPESSGDPRVLSAGSTKRVVYPEEAVLWHRNPMTVGGGSRVYGAQAWRFSPSDFRMASRYGVPAGSALADWPIDYDELEPYYSSAESLLGVAGGEGTGGGPGAEGRRGCPFPMPPTPDSPLAPLLRGGAEVLGFGTGPVPLAVNTVPYAGRPACLRCGSCVGFGCPGDMKNGSHNTTLTLALRTGRCDLLLATQVGRITVNSASRADGVLLLHQGAGGVERRTIRARFILVGAGAVESARLLLNSAHDAEPHGLGNDEDMVGRHLQGHVYSGGLGLFDEDVQDSRGPGSCLATSWFRHGNPGVVGGGVLANDFVPTPLNAWNLLRNHAMIDKWGLGTKTGLARNYRRMALVLGATQEVTSASSRVSVANEVTDRLGLPVARLSGGLHPADLHTAAFLSEQAVRWLQASGARSTTSMYLYPSVGPSGFQHQAGTCRMGEDPRRSVTDRWGRLWSQPNVVIVDGSTHVTNGSVNPMLTIFANSLRIADHLLAAG
jgi:choline dehydrogenase-like flavoprotein